MESRRGNRKDSRRGNNQREENKSSQAVYRPKPKKNQTSEAGFTGEPESWFDGK